MADPSQPPSAWTDDLLRAPHAVADKRGRVQKMFAAIAPRYDLNNRLHSFGMDQRWRRKAVKLAELKADDRVVDVACGTGDLTHAMYFGLWWSGNHGGKYAHQTFDGIGEALGIDLTHEMLPRARQKLIPWKGPTEFIKVAQASNTERLHFIQGDATALPLADASADVVSIAFGIRNVQEPAKALAEFFRVLKPGGRVIILEFSQPRNRILRFFNDLYCNRIMPTTATWISGDKSGAYKYLPMSVKTFVTRETMMQMMRDAGFVDVTQHPMTFGVAVVYRGYKR